MDNTFYDGHDELYHHAGAKMWCLFLLTGQKSGFSLHRFRSNSAVPTGTWVRLTVRNFRSIGADGWECGPQNIKNFHFLVESPRFPKFLRAFIRLIILRQSFKFRVICVTGYGVIAEKPRVRKLGQIFPCSLYEKLYVG